MKINVYATLRRITGGKEVDVETPAGSTVSTLVDELFEKYPDMRAEMLDANGALRPHVHFFIDGKSTHHLDEGIETIIKEGAKVDVFPAVAGG